MVNAIPTANANRAGFIAISSWQTKSLGRIVRAKSAERCEPLHTYNHRYFDGNNRGRLYQFASQPIDQGVDIVTISKRLGHGKPDITLRIYAHLFRKDAQRQSMRSSNGSKVRVCPSRTIC